MNLARKGESQSEFFCRSILLHVINTGPGCKIKKLQPCCGCTRDILEKTCRNHGKISFCCLNTCLTLRRSKILQYHYWNKRFVDPDKLKNKNDCFNHSLKLFRFPIEVSNYVRNIKKLSENFGIIKNLL